MCIVIELVFRNVDERLDLRVHGSVLALGPGDSLTEANRDIAFDFALEVIVIVKESGDVIAFDTGEKGSTATRAGSIRGFGDIDEVDDLIRG